MSGVAHAHPRRSPRWPAATLLLFAALFPALFNGCRPDVAFRVDGQPIPVDRVERAARLAGTEVDDPLLLEQLVSEELLLQEANRLGLAVGSERLREAWDEAAAEFESEAAFRQWLHDLGLSARTYRQDQQRRLLLLQLAAHLADDVRIPDAEVRRSYEENLGRLTEPERWGVLILAYDRREEALDAREAILQGRDEEELIEEAGPGSGPTELSRSETSPERLALLAAAERTPLREPSEVLALDGRFLVIIPRRYYRPYAPAFEEIEPILRARLEQREAQLRLAVRLAELRSGALVEWDLIEPSAPPSRRDEPTAGEGESE